MKLYANMREERGVVLGGWGSWKRLAGKEREWERERVGM